MQTQIQTQRIQIEIDTLFKLWKRFSLKIFKMCFMNFEISVMSLNLVIIYSLGLSLSDHLWVMTINGIFVCICPFVSFSLYFMCVRLVSVSVCVWAVMSCVMEPKCGVCGVQRLLAAHNLYSEGCWSTDVVEALNITNQNWFQLLTYLTKWASFRFIVVLSSNHAWRPQGCVKFWK